MTTPKPKLKSKTVSLLRKIQKHILAEPRRLDMSGWGYYDKNPDASMPPCGTVGCIAGWALVLTGAHDPVLSDFPLDTYTLAEEVLALEDGQAERLFLLREHTFGPRWPVKYECQYHRAKSPQGRARAAVRRIDHFIKTGGAE